MRNILGIIVLLFGTIGCIDLDSVRKAASLTCQVGYYSAIIDTKSKMVKSEEDVIKLCDEKSMLIGIE